MEASRQETLEKLHGQQLSEGARRFYKQAYAPARAGCLNLLRRAGCSEEEAEDIFQTSFERVMETIDPIARRFAIPQMVNLLKTSCRNRMIDERRHQGILHRVPLADAGSLSDEA